MKDFLGLTEKQFYGEEEYNGSLHLGSLTSIPEGFNPTVGEALYLGSELICINNIPVGEIFNRFGRNYIYVDEIITEVIGQAGNVYHVKHLGKKEETYLVTDGAGKWSHGETLKEAREDLIYKISDRDKSVYSSLSLDHQFTFAEAVESYRVITGACAAGTKNFVESLDNKKESYTIAEIIELTRGAYGGEEYRRFFN